MKKDYGVAAGAPMTEAVCTFPQPAARRVYCHPAPFTSDCGREKHLLSQAYGVSTYHPRM